MHILDSLRPISKKVVTQPVLDTHKMSVGHHYWYATAGGLATTDSAQQQFAVLTQEQTGAPDKK